MKSKLRAQALCRRKQLSTEQHLHYSQSICTQLNILLTQTLTLPPTASLSIAFFWPIQQEPNCLALAQHYGQHSQWHLCLPRTHQQQQALQFHTWQPGITPLNPDITRVPAPYHTEQIHPKIILLPALGFDSQGFRLGYGAGYYDRTLRQYPQSLFILVSFDFSYFPSIHPQAHDISAHYAVTNTGIHTFGQLPAWAKRELA